MITRGESGIYAVKAFDPSVKQMFGMRGRSEKKCEEVPKHVSIYAYLGPGLFAPGKDKNPPSD